MKTTYQRVAEWNKNAGKVPAEIESPEYWVALENQVERIQEELDETKRAIQNRDLVEVLDGGCDLDVTVSGFNFLTDLPYDEAIDAVLTNNDVKLTQDLTLAYESKEALVEETLAPHIVVVSTFGEEDWYSVHRSHDDKVCKLLNHPRVDLAKIVLAGGV